MPARPDADPTAEMLNNSTVEQHAQHRQWILCTCYAAVQVLPAGVLTPAATIHMNIVVVVAHKT